MLATKIALKHIMDDDNVAHRDMLFGSTPSWEIGFILNMRTGMCSLPAEDAERIRIAS